MTPDLKAKFSLIHIHIKKLNNNLENLAVYQKSLQASFIPETPQDISTGGAEEQPTPMIQINQPALITSKFEYNWQTI